MKKANRNVLESIIVMVVLLGILGYLIIFEHLDSHIPILFSLMLLIFYGKAKGYTWDEIHDGIIEGIKPGIIPIIIFLLIGILVATWIMSGTIPTIMVYGFHILSAKFFLPSVFILCALIGIVVGSSFTTISTIGIAFLGIGQLLGINDAMTVGAIVSGAFLGNNVSPLSDTTNLEAAIGEVDLFDHIAYVSKIAAPVALIGVLFYTAIGNKTAVNSFSTVTTITKVLKTNFSISVVSMIPVVLLLICARKKVPAIPTLLLGATCAVAMSACTEKRFSIQKVADALLSGYKAQTGNQAVDSLLSRGGINSMMGSASLIILALALGGLLIKFEIISLLINQVKKFVHRPSELILLTAICGLGINFLVGEQYLSVILPGETFKGVYDQFGIDKRNLTRVLAYAGAAANSLIPWGVSGTFIASTMRVSVIRYIPFAFYPLAAPLIAILSGLLLKQKVKNK